jgi:hypothetical protein
MKKKAIWLSLLVILLLQCEKERTEKPVIYFGRLKGIVINEFDQGIDQVTVTVHSATINRVITGETGGYYLTDSLPVDDYDVTVSRADFISATKTTSIVKNLTTQLDFKLEAGMTSMKIEDSIIYGVANNGQSAIRVNSNTNWIIQETSSWLTTTKSSGKGDDSFYILWTDNSGNSERTDTVTVICGPIVKKIIVIQYPRVKLLEYYSVMGNADIPNSDSIVMIFNRPVTVDYMKHNYLVCSEVKKFTYEDDNHVVKFSFNCGSIGESLEFVLSVTDSSGQNLMRNLKVNLYSSMFVTGGNITDYLITDDNSRVIVATENPNKIWILSMDSLNLLGSIDLSVRPASISFNPANGLIYMITSQPYAASIYAFSLETKSLIHTIEVKPTIDDASDYPCTFPLGMDFTASGLGIVTLTNITNFQHKWRIIDSHKGDSLYVSEYFGSGTGKYTSFRTIHHFFDRSALLLIKENEPSKVIMADNQTLVFSSFNSPNTDAIISIIPDKKETSALIVQNGQQFIIDKSGTIQHLDMQSIQCDDADFCLTKSRNKGIFFANSTKFGLLNIANGSFIPYRGISGLHNIHFDADGKYLFTTTDNQIFKFDAEHLNE